jgi:hypothetical protein
VSIRVKIQTKSGHKIINLNRRRAIKERCLNCSGFKYSEIKNCDFFDCPLHAFRSGKGKQNAKARNKAIRQYCLWCCAGQSGEVLNCPILDCPLWPYRKGRIDRSSEIVSMQKNEHIEATFESN